MPDFTSSDDEAMADFERAFKGPSTQDRPFALGLSERDVQRAVFAHWKRRGAPNSFMFHPRNSGIHRGGSPAASGVIAGVPDIIVLTPKQTYALELKTEKGRLSKEQIAAMGDMGNAGCITGVAYGLNEALAWLEDHGILEGRS